MTDRLFLHPSVLRQIEATVASKECQYDGEETWYFKIGDDWGLAPSTCVICRVTVMRGEMLGWWSKHDGSFRVACKHHFPADPVAA